jgi:phosphatidylglycerophosphatase A
MFGKKILEFIVTFGFIGKIKIAPGTFGSLAAFVLMYFVLSIISRYHILDFLNSYLAISEIALVFYFVAALVIFLFIIGVITSSLYIKKYSTETDPKKIVIDEVVGQMLTSILCFFGIVMIGQSALAQKFDANVLNFIFVFLLPFGLFRFFDICKPWPIDYIDSNIKGGLGIMLDDVLAAIFAAVTFYALIFCIINFYP